MEIKKEIVEKDFDYLHASLSEMNPHKKHVPIFAAMLSALLSSSSIYATSMGDPFISDLDISDVGLAGGTYMPVSTTIYGYLQWSVIIVGTIALITTIVYGVKMQTQKKKENLSLEKTKKKFKISIITFAVCFLLFIVIDLIFNALFIY